jgi:hypothetical protein
MEDRDLFEDGAPKWAWAPGPEAETWQGLFDTREEAEAAGRLEDEGPGVVAEARWFDPAKALWYVLDIDELLCQMDEATDAINLGDTEAIFELCQAEGAPDPMEALRVALAAWAKDNVSVARWQVTGEPQAVAP